MALIKAHRLPRQLDQQGLQQLALRYVGKYATTRAKLRSYLARKLKERGWSGEREADLDSLACRLVELGYIDDAAYALAKSRSLSARGYGLRRVSEKLRLEGLEEVDAAPAIAEAGDETLDAALRFARRRRFGPFSNFEADPRQREKWIAAMVRAGHSIGLSRAISHLAPGAEIDRDGLGEHAGRL